METLHDFGAGCVGGAAGLLVGHPFDTVKVRLQLQTNGSYYRGTLHCFKAIVQQEGFRGLYKGISSPMYSFALINAIVFGVQGNIHRRLSDPTSISSYALSGGAAGFVQSFIGGPMELVKIRMQMQGTGQKQQQSLAGGAGGSPGSAAGGATYRGAMDCLSRIVRTEGVRGIYRGMTFTVLREVPAYMIYFASYEHLCRQFSKRRHPAYEPAPTWALLLSGGLAGCLSWLFLNPVDVIKSRMQMDGVVQADGRVLNEYRGYADCISKSLSREGYSVLTKGLTSTLLRAFPANAATLTTVTWLLRLLNPKATEEQRADTAERSGVIAQLD